MTWRYQPDVITFPWHSAIWVELQYICSGDRSGIGIRPSCYALGSDFARLMSTWFQPRQYWCGLEFFKASFIVQHKDAQKVRTPLHFCLPGYTLASRPLPTFLFTNCSVDQKLYSTWEAQKKRTQNYDRVLVRKLTSPSPGIVTCHTTTWIRRGTFSPPLYITSLLAILHCMWESSTLCI